MLKALSDRPEVERLESFLARLQEQRGEELEFIVLYGSMARGDWSQGSDYDLLIGLRGEDRKRLIDRMQEFSHWEAGNIEVFPYSCPEWQRMFEEFHPLLLEALEYGVVLWDRGTFARMRETFREWRAKGGTTVEVGLEDKWGAVRWSLTLDLSKLFLLGESGLRGIDC